MIHYLSWVIKNKFTNKEEKPFRSSQLEKERDYWKSIIEFYGNVMQILKICPYGLKVKLIVLVWFFSIVFNPIRVHTGIHPGLSSVDVDIFLIEGIKRQSDHVFFLNFHPLFSETDLLQLVNSTKLPGLQALGIFLFSPPQCGGYRHTSITSGFYVDSESKLWSEWLCMKHFTKGAISPVLWTVLFALYYYEKSELLLF